MAREIAQSVASSEGLGRFGADLSGFPQRRLEKGGIRPEQQRLARCHWKIPVHVSDLTWPVMLAPCPERVRDATRSSHNVPQDGGHRGFQSMLQS